MGALGAIRFLLKTLNVAMLFLGVSLATYSAVLLEQWHSGSPGSSATPGAPPAPPAPPAPQGAAPWFIWVAGSVALLLSSTGATGMAGATAHCPRGCISAYIAQMLLLLAFQIAALIALCVDPALSRLPADATGRAAAFAAFVRAHAPRVRAAFAAALALNAAALLLAGVLAAVAFAEDDCDDEEDGLSPAPGARRRITLSGESRLARGTTTDPRTERLLEPPAPAQQTSYTQRMRERYTGEAQQQRLSPARPRRLTPEALLGGAQPDTPPSKGASCSLM